MRRAGLTAISDAIPFSLPIRAGPDLTPQSSPSASYLSGVLSARKKGAVGNTTSDTANLSTREILRIHAPGSPDG